MYKPLTALTTTVMELQGQQPRPTTEVLHSVTKDILDTRGYWLHVSTSDVMLKQQKQALKYANSLDVLLLDVLELLPHNIPGHNIVIKHPLTGNELWYQSWDEDRQTPVYVPFSQWRPDEMVDHVIDRRAMLINEMSRSAAALEEIANFEAVGLSAVTEAVPQREPDFEEEAITPSDEPIDPYTD